MTDKQVDLGNTENKNIRKAPAICLSVAFSFMICLYAPVELYLTNIKDFWFDIYVMSPVMFVVFVLCSFVGSVVILLLARFCKQIYPVVMAIVFAVFVAFYIQGNYLVYNLPVLDGSKPKWEHYDTDKAISLIVWGLILVGAIFVLYKIKIEQFEKLVSVGSICITLMLLFTGVVLLFSKEGLQHKQMRLITTENEFEMSTGTNFIILLVDAVDAKTFDVLCEKHPEYKDYFKDFTYFSNTTAGYNCTMEAFPFIFSGKWYENGSFDEYLAEVYGEALIFDEMEAKNFDMGMYSNCMSVVEDDSVNRFSNIVNCSVYGISDYQGFVKLMMQYVGFRYLPYQFKENCFNYIITDFVDFRDVPEQYELVEDSNNGLFYNKLQKEGIITYTDKNVFKCIHLEGGHEPIIYNEFVEVVDDATYESQVEATMTIVHAYLEQLKGAGVYDNSIIVVMADHGNDSVNESRAPRYNAFFMVKGLGEDKDFKISKAPISHEDMPEAFSRLLDGAEDDEIFDWHEGDERDRRFFFYAYGSEYSMEEYIIGTDSRDVNSVYSTGKIY